MTVGFVENFWRALNYYFLFFIFYFWGFFLGGVKFMYLPNVPYIPHRPFLQHMRKRARQDRLLYFGQCCRFVNHLMRIVDTHYQLSHLDLLVTLKDTTITTAMEGVLKA